MAIIVAALIIGGAIFLTRGGAVRDVFDRPSTEPKADTVAGNTEDIALRTVDDNDHILGNPNAPVVMVEYSDLECPFCKTFHKTMQALLDTYGKDGTIAWVYRHFPLDIHPRAPREAQATECAFELAGNAGFWNYVNKIFEVTNSNNSLDPAELPKIAGRTGLDVNKFQTCLDSGKYAAKVKDDFSDGLRAGVNGTPHTVLVLTSPVTSEADNQLAQMNQKILQQLPPGSGNVITLDPSRKKVGVNGAFQYAMMKQVLDLLLPTK